MWLISRRIGIGVVFQNSRCRLRFTCAIIEVQSESSRVHPSPVTVGASASVKLALCISAPTTKPLRSARILYAAELPRPRPLLFEKFFIPHGDIAQTSIGHRFSREWALPFHVVFQHNLGSYPQNHW